MTAAATPAGRGPGAESAGRDETAPAIRLDSVGFTYRAQSSPTLHDVTLTIGRGEKVAIVGPSGSGKSTVVGMINGLIPHVHEGTRTGRVEVAGLDPAAVPIAETSRRVGTVLQDTDGQFVGLTVAEDVAFALENHAVPSREMPERVRRATALVGIDGHLDAAPRELSGGQRQRVSLAGVLVDEVDILVFDEPLASLDPLGGREAIELVDRLNRDRGTTVVIVEHRLEDVLHRNVDRVILMDGGRVIAQARPADLLSSGLLTAHGIREPLHLTALRYAGVTLPPERTAGDAGALRLTKPERAAVEAWAESAPPPGPSPIAPPVLRLENVTFRPPARPGDARPLVLDDVSLTVGRSEMVALVGRNGAGKSTLARLICGFERPSAGRILLGGADAADRSIADRGRSVGYVLQNPNQMISKVMIADEVALGLRAHGLGSEPGGEAEIERRVEEALRVCGLWSMRSWPVSALSYGQKKRVTIASVLVMEPDLLILDEPTAGQDLAHYTEMMEFVRALNQRGSTIILVTHDMHLALEYTDRALVLADGRLIADAPTAEVLTDEAVAAAGHLVTTGLFELARTAGVDDAAGFVERFITEDRRAREVRHGH